MEADPDAYAPYQAPGFGTQVGGWEQPIQSVLHGEAAALAAGSLNAGADAFEDVHPDAGQDWVHILTIYGESCGLSAMRTWNDGALFVLVHRDDLAARNFDRAVGIRDGT